MPGLHLLRAAVVLCCGLLLTTFIVAPATADQYPNLTVPAGPDKADHSYCFSANLPPGPAVKARVNYSMDNHDGVEAQTVVNTTYAASCAQSTDVIVGQDRVVEDFGEGFGATKCRSHHSNGRCDQWALYINNYYIQLKATNDGYQQRKTACHEIGHTLGLMHYGTAAETPDANGAQSCMRSGLWDNGAVSSRSYGSHHRAHVNAWFSTLP